MAIVELSIVPVGTASTGVSDYVAAVQVVLAKEKGIKYMLTGLKSWYEKAKNGLIGPFFHFITYYAHNAAVKAGIPVPVYQHPGHPVPCGI